MRDKRPPRHAGTSRSRRAGWDFGLIDIVLQPIIDVSDGATVAAESLARFPGQHDLSVEEVFAVAYASGRGFELEAACLKAALLKRGVMSANQPISVNVSPDALAHPAVKKALEGDLSGIIVEVTEHAAGSLDVLRQSLADIRRRGGQIAIDDASTGYAGLLRLTALRPDVVKLDRGLVTGVRDSVEQAAVVEALVSLSRRIGARVLGEGVESTDDLITLAELDVDYAQGWFIAPPATEVLPASSRAVAACLRARRALMTTSAISAEAFNNFRTTTAALAGSFRPADLQVALSVASADLDVDEIVLSTLDSAGYLRQISAAGAASDDQLYAVAMFPATESALSTGVMVEAHLRDHTSDAAERELLAQDGLESMLLTPVMSSDGPLGILEFRHRTHRRWTSHDLYQARDLAEHVASALQRMHCTHMEHGIRSHENGITKSTDGLRSAAHTR
jgi:EAL domain-containing protein (putative c-di-GMP-specific phosphodiesterase class I)